jgi:DNA-binding transcriptional LysR family regulator
MELRQLELFVAVAEERQFTRAAQRCHIGQSALSTAIRTLERDLGVTLFARTTRRVDLTSAGLRLLGESRRTLAAAQDARTAVLTAGTTTDRLAVGGVGASGGLDQLGAIAGFRRRYPQVAISYVRAPSSELIEDVRLGRLDAAFVTLSRGLPAGIHATELLTEPVTLMCRFDHPLAQCGSVAIEDLAHEEFVAPAAGTLGGEWFREQFEPAARRPPVTYIVNDAVAILEFVASGLGVALLPMTAADDHPQIRAVAVTGPGLGRTLGIVTQSRDPPASEARALGGSVVGRAA